MPHRITERKFIRTLADLCPRCDCCCCFILLLLLLLIVSLIQTSVPCIPFFFLAPDALTIISILLSICLPICLCVCLSVCHRHCTTAQGRGPRASPRRCGALCCTLYIFYKHTCITCLLYCHLNQLFFIVTVLFLTCLSFMFVCHRRIVVCSCRRRHRTGRWKIGTACCACLSVCVCVCLSVCVCLCVCVCVSRVYHPFLIVPLHLADVCLVCVVFVCL